MLNLDSNLVTSIIIYLSSCYALYNYKHNKMFDERGNFRSFGLSKDETVFPYWLVTTLIGLSSYYFLIIKGDDLL